jgi:hypothetical protein
MKSIWDDPTVWRISPNRYDKAGRDAPWTKAHRLASANRTISVFEQYLKRTVILGAVSTGRGTTVADILGILEEEMFPPEKTGRITSESLSLGYLGSGL